MNESEFEFVNGAIGTIKRIIFEEDNGPSLPIVVFVEFDKYNGPVVPGFGVPIVPFTAEWLEGNKMRSRQQLQLTVRLS